MSEVPQRLSPATIAELCTDLHDDWRVVDGHHLVRDWSFPDFATGLDLVNRIGALAEREAHHPDLMLRWGAVRAELHTHDVGGLTRLDFSLAMKIDQL